MALEMIGLVFCLNPFKLLFLSTVLSSVFISILRGVRTYSLTFVRLVGLIPLRGMAICLVAD